MYRRLKPLRNRPFRVPFQSRFAASVVLTCLFVFSPFDLVAQEKAVETLPPFRLDLIPEEAMGVIAVRPAQLLNEPVAKPIQELVIKEEQQNPKFGLLGLKPTHLKTVTLIYFRSYPVGIRMTPLVTAQMIQSTEKLDRGQIRNQFSKSVLVEAAYKDLKILTTTATDGDALVFLDEHTLIVSNRVSAMMKILDQLQTRHSDVWSKRLKPFESASVAGAVNLNLLRQSMGRELIEQLTQNIPIRPLLSALWNRPETAVLGITVQKKLTLELSFQQAHYSEDVKQSLEGLLGLGQALLQQRKAELIKTGRPLLPDQGSLFELAEQVMGSLMTSEQKKQVTLSLSLDQEACDRLVGGILPVILSSRDRARRASSMNNMKQIMLALHNYHSLHGHFPPAVVMGPDGKTPHSWRVELLPFLDQKALYQRYRMNEPWDSEHNLKIAKTVVPVFNHPKSEKPANSSYFVVVGEGTAFGNKKGVSFKDITDGTSNTIALVEAKRDIPWTKPEDITYDGKQLPEFGGFHEGGFSVGKCDGSVRFISNPIDGEALKRQLLINDGLPQK